MITTILIALQISTSLASEANPFAYLYFYFAKLKGDDYIPTAITKEPVQELDLVTLRGDEPTIKYIEADRCIVLYKDRELTKGGALLELEKRVETPDWDKGEKYRFFRLCKTRNETNQIIFYREPHLKKKKLSKPLKQDECYAQYADTSEVFYILVRDCLIIYGADPNNCGGAGMLIPPTGEKNTIYTGNNGPKSFRSCSMKEIINNPKIIFIENGEPIFESFIIDGCNAAPSWAWDRADAIWSETCVMVYASNTGQKRKFDEDCDGDSVRIYPDHLEDLKKLGYHKSIRTFRSCTDADNDRGKIHNVTFTRSDNTTEVFPVDGTNFEKCIPLQKPPLSVDNAGFCFEMFGDEKCRSKVIKVPGGDTHISRDLTKERKVKGFGPVRTREPEYEVVRTLPPIKAFSFCLEYGTGTTVPLQYKLYKAIVTLVTDGQKMLDSVKNVVIFDKMHKVNNGTNPKAAVCAGSTEITESIKLNKIKDVKVVGSEVDVEFLDTTQIHVNAKEAIGFGLNSCYEKDSKELACNVEKKHNISISSKLHIPARTVVECSSHVKVARQIVFKAELRLRVTAMVDGMYISAHVLKRYLPAEYPVVEVVDDDSVIVKAGDFDITSDFTLTPVSETEEIPIDECTFV